MVDITHGVRYFDANFCFTIFTLPSPRSASMQLFFMQRYSVRMYEIFVPFKGFLVNTNTGHLGITPVSFKSNEQMNNISIYMCMCGQSVAIPTITFCWTILQGVFIIVIKYLVRSGYTFLTRAGVATHGFAKPEPFYFRDIGRIRDIYCRDAKKPCD